MPHCTGGALFWTNCGPSWPWPSTELAIILCHPSPQLLTTFGATVGLNGAIEWVIVGSGCPGSSEGVAMAAAVSRSKPDCVVEGTGGGKQWQIRHGGNRPVSVAPVGGKDWMWIRVWEYPPTPLWGSSSYSTQQQTHAGCGSGACEPAGLGWVGAWAGMWGQV